METTVSKNDVETINYRGHGFISVVKFNKYGDLLFIGDKDSKKIVLYDVINKSLLGEYNGHNGVIWCIDTTENSEIMISGSGDTNIIVWNTFTGKPIKKIAALGIPKIISINNELNKFIVYCDPIGKKTLPLAVYNLQDLNSGEPEKIELESKITGLIWLSEQILILSYETGEIGIKNLNDNTVEKFKLHSGCIKSIQLNKERDKLLTGSLDMNSVIFDINKKEIETTIQSEIPIISAQFFPIRKYIVLGGGLDTNLTLLNKDNDFSTKFYSMKNKISGAMFGHNGPVRQIEVNPIGTNYVTAGQDGIAKIYYFNDEFLNKKVYTYEKTIDRKLFMLENNLKESLSTEITVYHEGNTNISAPPNPNLNKIKQSDTTDENVGLYKIKTSSNFSSSSNSAFGPMIQRETQEKVYRIGDFSKTPNDKKSTIKITNLPVNTTREELENVFDLFGRIKERGVSVKTYKNDTIAYINYEESSSAEKAFKLKNGDKFNHMILNIELLKDRY